MEIDDIKARRDELLVDLRAVNEERDKLRLRAREIQKEIDPLLAEIEAERKAHPTQAAPPQTVGG